MRKAITRRPVLFIALAVMLVAIVAFGIGNTCCQPEGLAPVEVREYEGVDLSSINDFRENSIKGPQEVDVETYTLEITGLVTNPTEYTYDEVLNRYQHYEKVVTLDCVEGWSVTILWEGVLVGELWRKRSPWRMPRWSYSTPTMGTRLLYLSST